MTTVRCPGCKRLLVVRTGGAKCSCGRLVVVATASARRSSDRMKLAWILGGSGLVVLHGINIIESKLAAQTSVLGVMALALILPPLALGGAAIFAGAAIKGAERGKFMAIFGGAAVFFLLVLLLNFLERLLDRFSSRGPEPVARVLNSILLTAFGIVSLSLAALIAQAALIGTAYALYKKPDHLAATKRCRLFAVLALGSEVGQYVVFGMFAGFGSVIGIYSSSPAAGFGTLASLGLLVAATILSFKIQTGHAASKSSTAHIIFLAGIAGLAIPLAIRGYQVLEKGGLARGDPEAWMLALALFWAPSLAIAAGTVEAWLNTSVRPAPRELRARPVR